jgi:hypothetical protein
MSHVVGAASTSARKSCGRGASLRLPTESGYDPTPRLPLALIATCIAGLLLCGPAHAEAIDASSLPRAALVIGNASYAAVGTLTNPVHDAQDMCRALDSVGFKTSCYFNVARRVELKALIQGFVESLPEKAVTVVYYAGHAVQVNGENYLIPTGAQLRTEAAVIDESVDVSYLMRELRQAQNNLNLVILDACRDNPLPAGVASRAQGLAQATGLPDGTVVWYATGANEFALDGTGHNGILTKNILAHIRDPGTIDELFAEVSSGVQKDALDLGRTQRPTTYGNGGGQYCLFKCTRLEELQAQKQDSDRRQAELEARIASGDLTARSQLDAEKKKYADLEAQTRKEKAAAEQRAKVNQIRAMGSAGP